jgi:hypothetical protein
MTRKSAKMGKAKPKSRAKVVVNSRPKGLTAALQRRRTGVFVVLAFVLVGLATLVWARAATTTHSLWSNSDVPKTISSSDGQSVELGVKFRSTYSGSVVGLRFYKGPQNTGSHVGNLWTAGGRKLATVTFQNETASGWQTAYFAQPVNISANTAYVISYFAPQGHYSVNQDYFTSARSNGPLTAPRKGNGLFRYASQSAFPNGTYKASNYWVDVIFTTSRFSPSPLPAAPTNLQATLSGSGSSVNLSWQASTSTGVTHYEVLRNGSVINPTVTGTTYLDTNVTPGNTYSYQVRAVDGGGKSELSGMANITVPAEPEPEPEPTPTPTPTPPPSAGRPDATNTGVPAGTVLTDYTGAADNSLSNTTFSNVRFRGSGYIFRGSNLVFKNCEFEAGGVIFEGNNIQMERCDVTGDLSINNSQGVTLLYNNIHNWTDGLHITSEIGGAVVRNVTASYNFIHTPQPGCGDHSDGVQLLGINGFAATYNTIDLGKQFTLCGDANPLNGAFQIKTDFTGVVNQNMDISNNYLNGGGYTLRLYQCAGTNRVTNNRFGRDFTWGPVAYTASSCPVADKSGNVYDDTGSPITL